MWCARIGSFVCFGMRWKGVASKCANARWPLLCPRGIVHNTNISAIYTEINSKSQLPFVLFMNIPFTEIGVNPPRFLMPKRGLNYIPSRIGVSPNDFSRVSNSSIFSFVVSIRKLSAMSGVIIFKCAPPNLPLTFTKRISFILEMRNRCSARGKGKSGRLMINSVFVKWNVLTFRMNWIPPIAINAQPNIKIPMGACGLVTTTSPIAIS
jgi:hypothetical protein